MPGKVGWYLEKRIIYSQGCGKMTREDLLFFIAEVERLIPEGLQPVHVIADRRLITKRYSNFTDTAKLLGMVQQLQGWFLVLEPKERKDHDNLFFKVVAQAVGLRIYTPFTEFEPLWQFLIQKDLTLPRKALELPKFFEVSA